jgi:hypothetical protein
VGIEDRTYDLRCAISVGEVLERERDRDRTARTKNKKQEAGSVVSLPFLHEIFAKLKSSQVPTLHTNTK